jgi:hypothetical protein
MTAEKTDSGDHVSTLHDLVKKKCDSYDPKAMEA